jgi:hypothetical protein
MTHTVESLMALAGNIGTQSAKLERIGNSCLYDACVALESALREALRDEYHRGIDAAAEKCRRRRAAAGLVVNEILALKETTP